jgi:glycerol uptake facilitator-like aquaporin
MVLIGAIGHVRGMVIATAQIFGGIASAAVVSALFPGPLMVRTSLAPGTSATRGLFIEMFLTAELVFTMCVCSSVWVKLKPQIYARGGKTQGNLPCPTRDRLRVFHCRDVR